MLMQAINISTDTASIIQNSPIPFLIQLSKTGEGLSAGMLVQDNYSVNTVLLPWRVSLNSKKYKTVKAYLHEAKRLLSNNVLFMTSVHKPESNSRQTVVITEFHDDRFSILDPDCGLSRHRQYKYSEVEDMVFYSISTEKLINLITFKDGDEPVIGYLAPQSENQDKKSIYNKLIKQSKSALAVLEKSVKQIDFQNISEVTFIDKWLKPIVVDLRVAIEIWSLANHTDPNLIKYLAILETILLEIRSEITDKKKLNESKVFSFKMLIEKVLLLLVKSHIDTAPVYKWINLSKFQSN
ncbi:MAG: hypothetical protein APR63_11870 [Desulfuromonas sp. SDB]|nr:MAG: hypothetical protein APR63_11870 [Desulfuromonas sp. SDB]